MNKDSVKLYLYFLKYAKPFWKHQIIILLILIITTCLSMASPLILKIIIDQVFPYKDFDLLIKILVLLLGLTFIRIIFGYIQSYLFEWVADNIMLNIRRDLFQHLIHLPLSFYDKNKTGDIIHRLNNDANSIQSLLTGSVLSLIQNILTIIVLIIVLFLLNYKLLIISLIILPFVFINTLYFQPKIYKNIKLQREMDADLLGFMIERFENVRLIKSYNKYNYEIKLLNYKIKSLIYLFLQNIRLSSVNGSISTIIISISSLAVFGYGGYQVIIGVLSLGSLIAFIQFSSRLLNPLRGTMGLYWNLIRSTVSMKRIIEFLDIPIQNEQNAEGSLKFSFQKEILFKNVTFKYDGQLVLNNLNLNLEFGKKYALVGSSGCGKSTIINLLCRFYDDYEGEILIDGNKIKEINMFELRDNIVSISQDNFLFHNSIRENIRYGSTKAGGKEIIDATKFVGIHDHILTLEDGLDSIIGDKGTRLSGGQKQRIALARAIIKNSDVIILDEATSALDSESEKIIFENLCSLYKNRTMIFISHRISVIKDVDIIICMDKGQIVERGAHEELISKQGFYFNLFKEQFI